VRDWNAGFHDQQAFGKHTVENASPDRLCDLIIIDESNEWTLFELMDV